MDEELREWKFHFNICDAAHLALRNILTRHVLPPGHSQSAALDAMVIVATRRINLGTEVFVS